MSSDVAITVPFQVAVDMPPLYLSPAKGVHLPRLRSPAGPAVAPRDDAQRGGRRAALGAVDGVLRVGPRLGDLLGAFLVDRPVAPAGASQVCFSASSRPCRDGVPPGRSEMFVLTLLRCARPGAAPTRSTGRHVDRPPCRPDQPMWR